MILTNNDMISELTQLAIKAAIEASKDILTIYKSTILR